MAKWCLTAGGHTQAPNDELCAERVGWLKHQLGMQEAVCGRGDSELQLAKGERGERSAREKVRTYCVRERNEAVLLTAVRDGGEQKSVFV